MAATPFAPLQQRLNSAVLRRLANAQAAVQGGPPVQVIFDQPYAAPFDGRIDAAEPECTGASADLAGVQRGHTIDIGGTSYRVERAEPDGSGLTRLLLSTADA